MTLHSIVDVFFVFLVLYFSCVCVCVNVLCIFDLIQLEEFLVFLGYLLLFIRNLY